jgi:hypothetical protein
VRTADRRRCSRFKFKGTVPLVRDCISKYIKDLFKKKKAYLYVSGDEWKRFYKDMSKLVTDTVFYCQSI